MSVKLIIWVEDDKDEDETFVKLHTLGAALKAANPQIDFAVVEDF